MQGQAGQSCHYRIPGQHLSEIEGTTWGQAVTPDGKEKDYSSTEQGEGLNSVLQGKDVSKVQGSKQNKTKNLLPFTDGQSRQFLEKYQKRAMYLFYQTQEE